VQEKSSFAGRDTIGDWPLGDIEDRRPNAVRFTTIRSFKGLEAEIVFLTGIQDDPMVCTLADIYTGASRARFLLYVFHHADYNLPGV